MRIDSHLKRLPGLSREQNYFLLCWYNMVHKHSLDAYRVRAMNPISALEEIGPVIERGNETDRASVFKECSLVLKCDPLLATAQPFTDPASAIQDLLRGPTLIKKTGTDSDARTLMSFVKELGEALQASYVSYAFDELRAILIDQKLAAKSEADRFSTLHLLLGNLLSTLLGAGFSLESLFQVYWQVLAPRKVKANYSFERRLRLAQSMLTGEKRKYHVVFAVDQVTRPEDLPEKIGTILFSNESPFPLQARHASSAYLTQKPRRVFASTEIEASEPRAAALSAYEQLNDLVNLLRFEYEQSRLQMPDAFAFAESGTEQAGGRVFAIPMMVPNPPASLDGLAVAEFVKTVEELISQAHFGDEGRDRIYSAFRLYRLGRDSDVPETKLLNWWTAVEYLARGSSGSGSIGSSVESLLAPPLCLAFLAKHLSALRSVLVDSGATFHDAAGADLTLRTLNTIEFFEWLKAPGTPLEVQNALVDFPYAQEQARILIANAIDPKKLARVHRNHEEKVRWQLGRIWRARCDIVHSARRSKSTGLLCSNLEYYLKTVLHSLLRAIRQTSTLSGPREFFDRQAYLYRGYLKDAEAGDAAAIHRVLATTG